MPIRTTRSRLLHRTSRLLSDRYLASLADGLRVLYPGGLPTQVRRAVVRWSYGFVITAPLRVVAAVLLVGWVSGGSSRSYFEGLWTFGASYLSKAGASRQAVENATAEGWRTFSMEVIGLAIIVTTVWFTLATFAGVFVSRSHKRTARDHLLMLERRYRASVALYQSAARCGRARVSSGWARPSIEADVKNTYLAEQAIRQAWRTTRPTSGAITGYRRVHLKRHAGRVVAAVRAASLRVDADPDEGLRELGLMLATIAERCAEGRAGALLDEEQLAGHEPVRDYEALRIMSAAIFVAVAAIGIALLRLPATVAAPLTSAAGVIGVALVYRKAARQGMETMGALFGSGK